MNKWDDELLKIFDEAPFVGIKPAAKKSTVNDRLLRSFDEITEFVERNNRVPEDVGGDEGRLFARLRGIQSETWKREKCLPFDRLGLLAEQASQSPNDAIKDIFEDPIFNLAPETQAIFDIPDYMRKPVDIERPDYIARRVECKDFKEYEAGFRAVHDDLWNGKRKLIKFKDDHLHEGAYFVVGGVLVLLDRLEAISKNKDYKKDGRTRCIYENGTESDILLQTLAKSLYTDGYSIVDVSLSDDDYLKQNFTITDVDIPRDIFLVGCYTAQRFSDYSTINEGNIRTLENGQQVIDLKQQKTGNHVVIPIRPELQAILEKYDNRLPRTYEQKVNHLIKEIAREAGITEKVEISYIENGEKKSRLVEKCDLVKTHTARRSGATNMYLAGIPTIAIMKVTGHKTEREFMKYIKITEEQTALELMSHPYFSGASNTTR
ncbi:MAG: site-specific integrase [Alistipes sp.]